MNKLKSFIPLLKKYWWVILMVISLIGAFYWYEWRPSEIRKFCSAMTRQEASRMDSITNEQWNFYYITCLQAKGLNN